MNKWDTKKLKEMTNTENEYINIKLDYEKIAQKYIELVHITRQNGDVIPYLFDDVKIAYNGNIDKDIQLDEITDDIQEMINDKENNRKIMHIKHFSRDISHQKWFEFLEQEVKEFLEKYSQFSDFII